jgi:hypothetical protein
VYKPVKLNWFSGKNFTGDAADCKLKFCVACPNTILSVRPIRSSIRTLGQYVEIGHDSFLFSVARLAHVVAVFEVSVCRQLPSVSSLSVRCSQVL